MKHETCLPKAFLNAKGTRLLRSNAYSKLPTSHRTITNDVPHNDDMSAPVVKSTTAERPSKELVSRQPSGVRNFEVSSKISGKFVHLWLRGQVARSMHNYHSHSPTKSYCRITNCMSDLKTTARIGTKASFSEKSQTKRRTGNNIYLGSTVQYSAKYWDILNIWNDKHKYILYVFYNCKI
jgi:hypothetical protein